MKRYLLLLLFLTGCSSVNLGGGEVATSTILSTELMEVPEQYSVERHRYVHFFKDNLTNAIVEIETTKEEYDALSLKDAGQPVKDGAIWLRSIGGELVYSSTTIPLKDFEFSNISISSSSELLGSNQQSLIRIKLPNEKEAIIEKIHIKKNKLDLAGFNKIKSEAWKK